MKVEDPDSLQDVRIRTRLQKYPDPPVVDAPVDRLLVGSQDGHLLEQWIPRSREYARASLPLAVSPYVTLLEASLAHPDTRFDGAFLRETAYFRMALTCAQRGFGGHWFFARSEDEILQHCGLHHTAIARKAAAMLGVVGV